MQQYKSRRKQNRAVAGHGGASAIHYDNYQLFEQTLLIVAFYKRYRTVYYSEVFDIECYCVASIVCNVFVGLR